MATLDTQLSVTDERELQNRLSASSPVGSGGTGSIGESEAHVSMNVVLKYNMYVYTCSNYTRFVTTIIIMIIHNHVINICTCIS